MREAHIHTKKHSKTEKNTLSRGVSSLNEFFLPPLGGLKYHYTPGVCVCYIVYIYTLFLFSASACFMKSYNENKSIQI